MKTVSGYDSSQTVLVNFDCTQGAYPVSGLISDAAGNLFGTTSGGGVAIWVMDTVFEIFKTSTGYASTPTVLFNFYGIHGVTLIAGLIVDAAGDLFCTTS